MSIDWSLISPVLAHVIEVAILGLIGYIGKFLHEKIKIDKYMHKSTAMKDIVGNMISFAEQTCSDLSNSSKFAVVLEESRKKLNDHGVKVTVDELQKFIEGTLKEIKTQAGEKWSESVGQ